MNTETEIKEYKIFSERMKKILPHLPKNYAIITEFFLRDKTRKQIYSVRNMKLVDFEVLEFFEKLTAIEVKINSLEQEKKELAKTFFSGQPSILSEFQ